MKQTVVKTPETIVPDSVVRRAIDYLDSPTDYRECLPDQHRVQTIPRRGPHKRTNDVEDFLLVFVPLLLVAIAIVAVVLK